MRRTPRSIVVLLALAAALGCNRNVEPYDPDEPVVTPDLSRIFPEAAERTGDAQAMRSTMPPPEPQGAPAPAARGGQPLSGTIRLADTLAGRVPGGAVLFLIARTGSSGPPTAVRRIESPRFPLDFEIGPDDRMIDALPFEGPFQLVVRVDADHNAMTRNPGDLQGEAQGSFSPGATGIEIVIDEVL